MKFAVITPYFSEPSDVLERCFSSVKGQTVRPFAHYFVADGAVDRFAADPAVRHVRLDRPHADWGIRPEP